MNEEIFEIKTFLNIYPAEKADRDVTVWRISKEKTALVSTAGDLTLGTDGTVLVFAGETNKNDAWRVLGGKIAAKLKALRPEKIFLDCTEADDGAALLEGLILGAYEFNKYKQPDKEAKTVNLAIGLSDKLFNEEKIICDAVNMAREWAHEPADVINPQTLSERAALLAERYGLKCTILDAEELKSMGAGAIVAVGQGSKTPSRMIVLEYGGTKDEAPVVLVGKAITFDSGGYSIKPSDSMMTMKYDKCGAADVLALLRIAAELKFSTPIVGVICASENMLSDKSYRPDDILHSLSGKTIEVKSTDAEGRLILADGLTYAQQHYAPRCIFDFATLTGACIVALGRVRAGVMCPNDQLFNELYDCGQKTWERIWRFPNDEDYAEMMRSPEADLKNTGGSREGGSITAGMFLKEFVADEIPWAHFDIAGVADTAKALPYCAIGATGFGIRLVAEWLKRQD